MTAPPINLRLGWWNTGLSPRKVSSGSKQDRVVRPRNRPEHRETAAKTVAALAAALDIFAIGETNAKDHSRIEPLLSHSMRMVTDNEHNTGIAVIYDSSVVETSGHETLIGYYGKKRIARSILYRFGLKDGSLAFHLYVCHWASRMRQQSERERRRLAQDLAWRIGESRRTSVYLPVVAIGDFNDEPFSESMDSMLLGYRDRHLVSKDPGSLYNPFWRHLGERQHIADEARTRLAAGTHFYPSDNTTRWFTLDQCLFSSEFLGNGTWTLDESLVGVISHPAIISHKGKMTKGFDHLPIVATLTR